MDYAIAAARSFQGLASEQKPFKFVFVSGAGATFNTPRPEAVCIIASWSVRSEP